ncbi:immunoglobulin domain protein [Dictyocaulus viviparus]|uniref:Immunoglobulin domain protein n=1 Tax=Dictyocaulus viviparus TaxID=29172 RepID=A0A0D8YBR8_DICVI|nr:immunoglobulin domain protein [Dictyocaulus viviparus]
MAVYKILEKEISSAEDFHSIKKLHSNFKYMRKMYYIFLRSHKNDSVIDFVLIDKGLSSYGYCHVRVIGNLAIVSRPIDHAGTEDRPPQSNVGLLWCGIEKVGEKIPVQYGEFTRLRDGKSRHDNSLIGGGCYGMTFALTPPPVLRFPTGSTFYEIRGVKPPTVRGGVEDVLEGHRIELFCPVFAFPEPFVRWEKDGKAIEPSTHISYDGNNLILSDIKKTMNGVYKCIADNSFPLFVDGPSMPHQLIYEQKLTVTSSNI